MITQGKRTGFYGWYALAGAMISVFISGGALINAFGVLLPSICEKFQWSRAIVAGYLSVGMLAFGLPSPIYGVLVNKLGPKLCIILGNFVAALGFAIIYFANEIWQFYLLYILVGAGCGWGGFIASTTIANNWFVKKRSLAFGFLISSMGLGGFAFPPLVAALVSSLGLKNTYLVLAGLVFIGSVVLAGFVLIRNRPEDMGEKTDIELTESHINEKEFSSRTDGVQDLLPLTKFLGQPTVWLIVGFVTVNSFTTGTMFTHQVAYLRDIGFSAMLAATTMSSLAIFYIIGCIVFGALAMRFDIRHLASLAFLFQFIAMVILFVTMYPAHIYVYTFFMGLSIGTLCTAMPTFIGAYYPQEYYSRITGFVMPFNLISQAAAASIVGGIFDVTHSYMLAFLVLIICAIIGMVCTFTARKPDFHR